MRYAGGKGKCFQRIINLMPPHRVYIETHLGGGAVMRHKRPAERSIGIELDRLVAEKWAGRDEPPFELVVDDAAEFLRKFAFAGGELVYSDPPYLPSTRKRNRVYRHDYSADDHIRLLAILKSLPAHVMVSGYASALYAELLSGWNVVRFNSATHSGIRQECLWMNFEPPEVLHDHRFLGDTFRSRQDIRRRQQRLLSRFDDMEPTERQAVIHTLVHRFGYKHV